MPIYDAAGRDRVVPNPVLTQISVEFAEQTSFVADRLFPTVRVTEQSARYLLFGRDAFALNFGGDARAPGSRANEIEGRGQWSEDTYFATEHALEELIPDEEVENNPGENPDADSVENLTGKILLGKEIAARNLAYDTTQYKANHVVTLAGTDQWDDYTNSDPIADFRDAFRIFHADTGLIPNLGVIPWTVMSWLEDHPKIVERYSNSDGAVTGEQIASILGLQEIVVPGGMHNSQSNPGLTASLSEIWTDNVVLGWTPGRPSKRSPAFGYEFLWPIPRGRERDTVQVDTRRDDDRIGDIHRVRRRYDLKLVGRDTDVDPTANLVAGFLFRDVLASA